MILIFLSCLKNSTNSIQWTVPIINVCPKWAHKKQNWTGLDLSTLDRTLSHLYKTLGSAPSLFSLFPNQTSMWKRNLRSPLSTLFHRQPLPSLSPLLNAHSPSPTHPLTTFSPFHSLPADQENRASDFPFHRFQCPRNLNLSWSKNFSSGIVVNQCWSCASVAAQTVPFLACENCRCVQPVDPSVDYFQIFGLWVLF